MGFLNSINEPEDFEVPIPIVELPTSSEEEEDLPAPVLLPEDQPRHQSVRRRRVEQPLQDIPVTLNARTRDGRRRSRRVKNCQHLLSLVNVGEDETDDFIRPQATNSFETLLRDIDAMKVWDSFSSQSEEKQLDFLLSLKSPRQQSKSKSTQPKTKIIESLRSNQYFKRLSPITKHFLFCENMSKDTLLSMEPQIIEFFQSTPSGQYMSDPLANNDRKVLHSLAEYLDLTSKSFNVSSMCEYRRIKVINPKNSFTAPQVLLSHVLGFR